MPSGSIFSVHNLSKLGVENKILRSDYPFHHTLYNLLLVQQRSKPMHLVSVAINVHDSWALLFHIIRVFNDLLHWLLVNIAIFVALASCSTQVSSSRVGIPHCSYSHSWKFLFLLSHTNKHYVDLSMLVDLKYLQFLNT